MSAYGKTTTGMENRRSRSFVNSDTLNGSIAVNKKPEPPQTSWWAEAPTLDSEAKTQAQQRMRVTGVTEANFCV